MKKSIFKRTLHKASGLLLILMPYFFFYASTFANPSSHKTNFGSYIATDLTISSMPSIASGYQRNSGTADTTLKSVAGNSYFSFAYLFQRNSYPNYIPLKAKAAPPTIVCPGNVTANTDPGKCWAVISLTPASTNDPDGDITTLTWKMSGANNTVSPVTGINFIPVPYTFNRGITTITYTVTDALGSQDKCSFTVTVKDSEPPTIICPVDVNIIIPSCATLSDPVTFNLLAFSDNCGIMNFTSNAPSQFPLGTTSVLWTGYDINGNSSQCTQVITVVNDSPIKGVITNQTKVICTGTATGSVTVAGNDGTLPYQYNINGGAFQANGTFSSLLAGTYTIIVKDVNGCQISIPVTITQAATALTASITAHTNALCAGQANGSATVTASGGNVPYTYSWNTTPLQTGVTAINLAAQNYTVTVTDANGCAVPASITITQPTALVVTISKTDVLCFGNANGTATASTSGGTPPYTYAWLTVPIQTTASIANLPAGKYTVAVFDSLGCFKPAFVEIKQPDFKLIASFTQVNVACAGSSTGSLTITGSGGVSPYQYNLNGGTFQASGTFSNLVEGPYTIIAKDANNCNATINATITGPAIPLIATISSHTNVLCSGQANGTATVTATGGTIPYTYSWNTTPIQITATANNLSIGTYITTVTDEAGCQISVNVSINEPTPLIVATSTTDVGCFGESTGTATAIASGGIPPYTYAWNTVPIQTTATGINLPKDTYTVAVFDSLGCFKPSFVTISQPATKVTASVKSQDNVVCAGNTGSVTVAGSGGTPPYQYSINGSGLQASGTFNGLSAGVYSVIAMDANNCTYNLPVIITEPANALHASISAQTNILCKGQAAGSATVTATDGNPPYAYSWNTSPEQTTSTISNLTAGNYIVTTTDNTGCFVIDTAFITEPALNLSVSVTNQVNYDCATGTNGLVTVAGAGGTPNYQYSLDGGPYQVDGTFTNLPAGNYTVTVRDTNNCEAPVSVQIIVSGLILAVNDDFTTQEDTGLNGNVMANDQVLCNLPITVTSNTLPQHGSLTLNANGTFTYIPSLNFNGNDLFDYTITDNAGGTSTATAAIIIDPVNDPPVTIRESITVNYNLSSSDNVLANGDSDPDGTALTVTTAPLLNPAHGTFVIAADGNFTYTPALNYIGNDIVIVNVCDTGIPLPSACAPDTIFIVVLPANLPPVTVNEKTDLCQNGSFKGTLLNGGSVFNGDTDPENNLPLTPNNIPVKGPAHGIFTITDLTTGTFDYTPNNGYSGSDSVIVRICDSGIPIECSNDTIFLEVHGAVIANAGTDQPIMPGSTASLSASASGGSGIYSWEWFPASSVLNPSAQSTQTVALNTGTSFIITATDITTGCYDTDTVEVSIDNTDYTPVAYADYDTTLLNTPVTINILENDLNPSGDPLIISFCGIPAHGIVVLNSDKTITYTPYSDYEGDDMICYSICNANIPSLCSDTAVFIHVKKPTISDLYPYTGISPNGDGKNDVWKIKNIEKYPDNTVIIFNRWGDKLREFAKYNNTDHSWDGKNEKGEFLPDGTYFYILDVKDVGVLKGWIYLRGTH